MYKDKTFLAIIPARGGSKRLPRKNILDIAGKPLIAWTIEASLASKYIDKVVVSSDNDEIITISKRYGSDVVKRPLTLAHDSSPSFDSVLHVVENMPRYDYIVLLQPTSPLRGVNQINEAIELIESKKADSIISVSESEHPPLWSNTLPEDRSMSRFVKSEVLGKRSQDLDKYYRLNGAIYIYDVTKLLDQGVFFYGNDTFAYVMDRKSSVDIDEYIDFKLAELLMKEGILS